MPLYQPAHWGKYLRGVFAHTHTNLPGKLKASLLLWPMVEMVAYELFSIMPSILPGTGSGTAHGTEGSSLLDQNKHTDTGGVGGVQGPTKPDVGVGISGSQCGTLHPDN